jgi:Ca2+:H+ antiporter
MLLDKLKGQAKASAWYDSPDDEANLHLPLGLKSPFTKYRSNTSRTTTLRDEERGMSGGLSQHRTNPEDLAASGNRHDNLVGHSPTHANTVPNITSSGSKSGNGNIDFPQYESPRNSSDVVRESSEKSKAPIRADSKLNGNTTDSEKDGLQERKSKRSFKDRLTGKGKEEDDNNNGKDKHRFTVGNQIRGTLFNSWINILLIASPVGIALYYAHVDPVVVFVINFIAIIPLAGMLSYATEEIALRTGEVIGGLLNASFGNAVELIVSIIALAKDEILIVQTSLIGSILSNLLLVMGMCFFFGGINRFEQSFNMTVAQTAASLLFLAVSSLIIPTAFDEFAQTGNQNEQADPEKPKAHVAQLSRGTAVLLLLVYGCYLFFQLKSHEKMFSEPSAKAATRNVGTKFKNAVVPDKFRRSSLRTPPEQEAESAEPTEPAEPAEEPREEPNLSLWVAIGTLAASTVLVALNAEYLVDSINAVTCRSDSVSKNFVGLILLPIVGNAAEHATAVTVAIKDKMDLAIGVAVGSSMQIALLVLPLVVVLGWIIGNEKMTLLFDGFQIAVLFVAVLLVNYLIQDGKSHWLEGVLLMIL